MNRLRSTAFALVAATLQVNHWSASAQIYSFENEVAPLNRSLHTLYAFYVFSHEDAPERPLGSPFVKFHDLVSHIDTTEGNQQAVNYNGIQLSLMKYSEFWSLINPLRFCCLREDVDSERCEMKDQLLVQKPPKTTYNEVDVYSHTIRFGDVERQDAKLTLRRTGVYVLVFSNCGDLQGAKVTGSVIVKNSYGFLPGNEYPKMPFYGWLLLAYVGLAIFWMILSVRWWREIVSMQNCISAVIFFGLVEAFLWYIFFNEWNSKGVRGRILFTFSILSSVIKSIFSYMLVLVAALGWGVTRPYLDRQVVLKIQAVSFLYIVLDFIRESVLSFRHSHSLSLAFVLLCLLPVSLLNGGIFYWVFTALSSLMETLRDRRQLEKLNVFQYLWRILVFALCVATATLLFQIFNLSRSITSRWKYQWIFAEGVSHCLFLFILVAMMYLWAPHKYSQRYAYSQTATDQDDNENAGITNPDSAQDVWAEEAGDEEEGDEGESFWETTHSSSRKESSTIEKTGKSTVPPDVVGAADGGGASAERI